MTIKDFFSVRGVLTGLGLACLMGLSAPSVALTPDGSTPANEGVCDVLQGGTPGLYGLCIAYCEAQDLDLVGDKEAPNTKILENYRKKMRDGDPDMPCVQVPCPCWNAEQLANIGATAPPVCNVSATDAQVVLMATQISQFASVDLTRNRCQIRDTTTGASFRFNVTADEAQSCYSQIVAKCSALGQ